MTNSSIKKYQSRKVLGFEDAIYCGKYTQDGRLYCVATQGFSVDVYGVDGFSGLHHRKSISARLGRWTLTDLDVSPDNKFVVFSTIDSTLQLASTDPEEDDSTIQLLNLNLSHSSINSMPSFDGFGVWTTRFVNGGKRLIAGTNYNLVYVYDIESKAVIDILRGHKDDVNAVSLIGANDNVICSGSDDTKIKVWDLRKRGNVPEPVGVFNGHTEGITYLAPKGDDRYILSNSKDQKMKLWDIRNLATNETNDESEKIDFGLEWDYRWELYPVDPNQIQSSFDNSIMSYIGHCVDVTLIRCGFSPPLSGSQYVYSGSSDGKIYVYNLLGELVSAMKSDVFLESGYGSSSQMLFRDVSWHPYLPVVMGSYLCMDHTERGGVLRFDYSV
ncbi:hypothetical protein H4219_002271 [Mycoemilia scoparia]|uniref:Uncharacterized protein n=1 Tax=Mycoemilia scoparia TaxID=417184 RepID=A0A9W8A3U4_9FUNG|nr:hypothetical protein H4219_002271 [Mycoemilia scoparia]